jgi:hypothetical protein
MDVRGVLRVIHTNVYHMEAVKDASFLDAIRVLV